MINTGRAVGVALLATVLLGVVGSCSAGDEAAPAAATATTVASAGLTAAQANQLAGVLYQNHQAGGAAFRATIPFGAAATFVLDGTIDWTNHVGAGTLTTRFANGTPDQSTALVFTRSAVLDGSIRQYDAQLQAIGLGGVRWVARPPDPRSVPLDVVLALVMGMASEQRENPLLLRQSGASLLRSDNLDGAPMSVFRYGERTRYWIGEDGRMRRVEAELAVAEGTTVIDLTLGPQQISLPADSEVTTLDRLPPEIQQFFQKPR